MADFVAGAGRLLDVHDPHVVANGFTERLEVAARAGAVGYQARSLAAPYFLTDLGVRRFADPAIFYRGHVDRFGWHDFIDAGDTWRLLSETSLAELAGMLDALILLLGDYDLAVDLVRSRASEILEGGAFELQVYSGVVLAASSDEGCRTFLKTAAAQPAINPVLWFMASHRLAAAEIKRFKNFHAGIDLLETIDCRMTEASVAGEVSNGDRRALESVTANLRALAFLGLRDRDSAKAEVERARKLATMEGLSIVLPSESARYTAQESINVAQMFALEGRDWLAVPVLDQNVRFCQEYCPEYVGEALSAYAYGLFLAEDHGTAAEIARQAVARVSQEAAPSRLRVAREILVGALAASGDRDQAWRELQLVDSDPLGLSVGQGAPESKVGDP